MKFSTLYAIAFAPLVIIIIYFLYDINREEEVKENTKTEMEIKK